MTVEPFSTHHFFFTEGELRSTRPDISAPFYRYLAERLPALMAAGRARRSERTVEKGAFEFSTRLVSPETREALRQARGN